MRKSKPHIGQIFFEGSSSLLGTGDESRRGGFRGRLEAHYNDYSDEAYRQKYPGCSWISTHGSGITDRSVLYYAATLFDDLTLVRRKALPGYDTRIIAILVFGSSLASILGKYDNNESRALQDYAAAMDSVRDACETHAVPVIGVGTPVPRENFRLPIGIRISSDMRQRTVEISQEHLAGWRVPSRFMSLQSIIDANPEFSAPDGAHLNSAGYDTAADRLISLIDPLLDINSRVMLERSNR